MYVHISLYKKLYIIIYSIYFSLILPIILPRYKSFKLFNKKGYIQHDSGYCA